MKRIKAIFWYLCLTTLLKIVCSKENSTKIQELDICQGIKLYVKNDELTMTVRMFDLLKENETTSRSEDRKHMGNLKDSLKKIGPMMMMVPFMMQLFSLPGAIAEIKMQLLRSIFMGKLAMIMIVYNALQESLSSQNMNKQVEYHQHHYNAPYRPEDEDLGWYGR